MTSELKLLFDKLDEHLTELGHSDSAIEFAPHQRKPMDKVISQVNEIKVALRLKTKTKGYFYGDEEDE